MTLAERIAELRELADDSESPTEFGWLVDVLDATARATIEREWCYADDASGALVVAELNLRRLLRLLFAGCTVPCATKAPEGTKPMGWP